MLTEALLRSASSTPSTTNARLTDLDVLDDNVAGSPDNETLSLTVTLSIATFMESKTTM